MAVALSTTYIRAVLSSVLLILTLQVLNTRSSTADCGEPQKVAHATAETLKTPSTKSEKFLKYVRYKCQDGYKRKAGTSNMAVCELSSTTNMAVWSNKTIECIDPSVPMTTRSIIASTTVSESLPHYPSTTTKVSTPSLSDTTRSAVSDFTSPTKSERFTPSLFTPVPKTQKTLQTTHRELTQSTQGFQSASSTKVTTTEHYHVTVGQTTHSTVSHSSTALSTIRAKGTVRTMTQSASPSTITSASLGISQSMPVSGYTSTAETLSLTPATTSSPMPDPESRWQQPEVVGSIAGVLCIVMILGVLVFIKLRNRIHHSLVSQEEHDAHHNSQRVQWEEEEAIL
ncbi:interleukin-15 receptor subunit alpha isoform X2 [Hyperolius riggenbachi]|uniref:interleukin-15 receptor subunit alpha isoform X2 n=1 Tax=Hyperolius riggenbachi TaxID=752182 RepID=UPI0035A3BEA1